MFKIFFKQPSERGLIEKNIFLKGPNMWPFKNVDFKRIYFKDYLNVDL